MFAYPTAHRDVSAHISGVELYMIHTTLIYGNRIDQHNS